MISTNMTATSSMVSESAITSINISHPLKRLLPAKAKSALKKPPSHARKPTTKAEVVKEATSKEDIPAPTKKVPAKSKATHKDKTRIFSQIYM